MADLTQQLLIQPATHVAIINPPEDYVDMLGPLEDNITMRHVLKGTFDFIQIFATQKHELEELVTGVINSLKKGGVFWISYPKETSNIKTNLSNEVLEHELEQYGFTHSDQIDINESWSAMRFHPTNHSEE